MKRNEAMGAFLILKKTARKISNAWEPAPLFAANLRILWAEAAAMEPVSAAALGRAA
jgi:hypothetical protein